MRITSRHALIETIAGLAVIIGLGWVLRPEDPLLCEVSPHPFWVVITLVALRYGSPAGGLCALACAGLYLAGLARTGPLLSESLQLDAWRLKEPLLFVIGGMFMAETVHSLRMRAEFLLQQRMQLSEQLAAGRDAARELEQAYRALEGRLAGETDTITGFFQQARAVAGQSSREIMHNLLQVLGQSLGMEGCWLWSREPGGHWRPFSPDQPASPINVPIAGLALREERVVNARELELEAPDADAGIIAGCLLRPDRTVRAVVAVKSMPFARFTQRNFLFFEMLLDWASERIQHQELLGRLRGYDVFDRHLGLTSELFFRTSAAKVCQQVRRQGQDSCLLFLRFPQQLGIVIRQRVYIVTAAIMRHAIRASDIAAYFREPDAFVIFLPGTNRDQAAIVREKILAHFRDFDIHPFADGRRLEPAFMVKSVGEGCDLDSVFVEYGMMKAE